MDPEIPQQPAPDEETAATAVEQVELAPIIRIGVETELSRYPIHNLSKKGRVDIQIIRKTAEGQVDLRWEVSYSERYGQARQFAYKLDTLIINRRLDEEGRPLPAVVRLGSLRDLADELGLDGSGDSTNRVKRALHQNAGAYITAKLKYRTIDGTEEKLEAGFTRYSVVFTGEKLPDGREADAVYLVLNAPFRQVLNNAPIRPLNYEYLKALPPAPQRFYEIISGRMYAALKNRNPFARILYSEFCTYSALTRHVDYENFRVQMAKIHKPHLKSGYIARVHYEEASDGEGRPDWMMCYQPGGRARAEYMTFARKNKLLEAREAESRLEGIEEIEGVVVREEGLGNLLPPQLAQRRKAAPPKNPLLAELMTRGITETKGKKILAGLAEGQQVLDQLEWGDHLIQSEPSKFRSPAGFYVYLLTENVSPPAAFETSRERKAREEAEAAAESAQLRRMQLEDEYEDYRARQVEDFIRLHMAESEVAEIAAKKRKHLAQSYRNFRLMPAEAIQSMVWGAVKAEVKPRVKFVSFQEFARERENQPSLFAVGESVAEAGSAPRSAGAAKEGVPLPAAGKAAQRAAVGLPGGAVAAQAAGAGGLGADDATLLARYEEFRRREARRALERLDGAERGRRMKRVRTYLLTEHTARERHQQLITEGEYEEFHRISEENLLEAILEELRLPNFEDWKRYALSAIMGN